MPYSSAVSSMVPPLSPDRNGTRPPPPPEAAAPKAAHTIDMVSVVGYRRPMASIPNNDTPGQDKWGIPAITPVAKPTVTGTIVHTMVTVDGGNQGVSDSKFGKASTTTNTDTIVEGDRSEGQWCAKSGRAPVKAGHRRKN
jgi:hypothetical protein